MARIKHLFDHAIRSAEKSVTPAYTSRLQAHAAKHNWPDEVVSKLSIIHDGKQHKISYPKSIEEQVLALEYGTQSVPPLPALRTFMAGA